MSHRIYTTDSIVLKVFKSDNSAYYLILTKELGLIRARAQGVRKIDSKLRFGLQEYSFSKISFVLGKNGWRITGALPFKNFYLEAINQRQKKIIANISAVVIRLLQGEESNPILFECVLNGLDIINKSDDENIFYFEILTMVRILFILGYVSDSDLSIKSVLEKPLSIDKEMGDFAKKYSSKILYLINNGLKESQL